MEKRKTRKMELNRKPLQGVLNIIRFNWHFYLIAGTVLFSLIILREYQPIQIQPLILLFVLVTIVTILISLIVSFYIYDLSGFYKLNWLPDAHKKSILNINAGFDETSNIIKTHFPNSHLTICDFYDPAKHTEVSIKRARNAYPQPENIIQVSTSKLPFADSSFDYCLAILSAHEIRDEKERIDFFRELNRITKSTGQIFVTEHLRDLNNFMAYTIGFFHFHSRARWLSTFEKANLQLKNEIKHTPFITIFTLQKNGITS